MSFLKLMQQRYTTKRYDKTQKLLQHQIDELAEILRMTPSSINSQSWQFMIIDNQDLKNKLAEHSQHNKEKVADCSHLVVMNVIDDLVLFEDRCKTQMAPYQLDYFKNNIATLEPCKVNAWLEHQVYIALGVLMAACAQMGVDSTAMEGIDKEKYTEILELKSYKTVLAVALGKRHSEDQNQPQITPKKRLDDVVQLIS